MPTPIIQNERPFITGKFSETKGSRLLDNVSQPVVMEQQAEVADFLSLHPLLALTLDESLSQISRFFGPHVRLLLDVIANEDTGEAAELYVAIETHLDVKTAMQALDAFCNDWLYQKPRNAWVGLIFDVKFP